MRIIIFSQVFYPENFKINELCLELIKLGHQVTVVTGKPNYPKGRFYKGYGVFSRIKEDYKGIKVYRLPIIPRGNASGLMLSLNYLSFALVGSIFSLFHFQRFDFSFVFAVSPLTSAIPAIVHKKLFGTKLFLWILDLWPEGVEVTGKLKFKFQKKMLYQLVTYIYGKSDGIFISSQTMKDSVIEKFRGKRSCFVKYLPNWAEDNFISQIVDKEKYLELMPKGFKIMFAGNIGTAQDFNSILDAAQILKEERYIKFIVLGDGSEKSNLLKKIKKLNLTETVYYFGSFPLEEMPNFYCHADMMLLTLSDESTYSFTVPGKLQGYLASKKPVAGMVNGESAEIIKKAECGFAVDSGDFESFAKEVVKISKLPSPKLMELGYNGYNYYKKTFTKSKVINSFLDTVLLKI